MKRLEILPYLLERRRAICVGDLFQAWVPRRDK
jgi:hypothetical protein